MYVILEPEIAASRGHSRRIFGSYWQSRDHMCEYDPPTTQVAHHAPWAWHLHDVQREKAESLAIVSHDC